MPENIPAVCQSCKNICIRGIDRSGIFQQKRIITGIERIILIRAYAPDWSEQNNVRELSRKIPKLKCSGTCRVYSIPMAWLTSSAGEAIGRRSAASKWRTKRAINIDVERLPCRPRNDGERRQNSHHTPANPHHQGIPPHFHDAPQERKIQILQRKAGIYAGLKTAT
jgi:hypothetical protein